MYYLSRWFLRFAAVLGVYSLFLLSLICWPVSGLILVGGALAVVCKWKVGRLTTLGSARFADDRDLNNAGMLHATTGLILGRVQSPPRAFEAICSLFWRIGSKEACDRFWDLRKRDRGRAVRLSQGIHTAVIAPTGLGKAVSCSVPFLRECDQSCVVVDFKGELAQLTAEHRKKEFGHRIVLLDPFGVVTKTPDSFNPLDSIDVNDPAAIDECKDLAKALVVRTPEEKEPHWNDSAEAWITGMLAAVVRYGKSDGLRSLQTVQELLSSPERIELAIQLMRESDAWDGMLARIGGQLRHFVDREKSSTLSTVSRHLRFLDTPAIAASTEKSTFDPAMLLMGKMTIYLILPPEHMRAQSALLRMWVGSFLKAVVRGGLRTKNDVHFVLDEAASLGNLEVIDDAVDKFRGFGIRLQFYFQSLGQLKKCFPNGQDQTLLSNTTQVFFGVNDTATAELVSSRLGDHTIIVDSGGTSDGRSWQNSLGPQPQQSVGHSCNTSKSWQQQARKLLKPEEVIALHPRVAITFTPGVPPICTTLLRYYEEPNLGRRKGWLANFIEAGRTFVGSLFLLGCSLSFALYLSKVVSQATGE